MVNSIIDKQTAQHYLWGENSESWILADTEALSVKQEVMQAGAKEKLHFHTHARQFFFILKGTAAFYLNNEKKMLTGQQGILVAPQTLHYIANETGEPLEFLVISQPATHSDRTNVDR